VTDYTAALDGFTPRTEESGTPNIRRIAEGRQHALATRDPAVSRVSAGVFWMVWRDGCNWALTSSAKMSSLFQDVAEQILLMSEARNAAPPLCPHCGGVLE
jgi:hypothetical protein